MRVLERPKEPPPTGIDALRAPKNTSGFVGVSAVGRKKDKYQAKWWCAEHNAQRALPGLHDTPEDAAAALLKFIEGAVSLMSQWPSANSNVARGPLAKRG